MRSAYWVYLLATMLLLGGCATSPRVENPGGARTQDIPVDQRGPVRGIGIEGADIVAMTDRMARDLISAPFMAGLQEPPRIIMDSQYFRNESTQRINRNAITDRLRIELNRASGGRMYFVSREHAGMVESERNLKRDGVTDQGTRGAATAQAGGDFRLTGRISSHNSRDANSGMVQRYNQIIFELVDLEDAIIVWGGSYEFQRASADDVIYR